MFPIDRRAVQNIWYPAPDVIPALCAALDDVPADTWNGCESLEELADAMTPFLEPRGGRREDFIWSMERHFSEPYGPLPKATRTFFAGIPDMFLANAEDDDGVERVAAPKQYGPGDDLPDDYREWLEKLFYAHGECMVPLFGEEAKDVGSMYEIIDEKIIRQAPNATGRLRFSNFANEELRHTFLFYELYSAYDPKLPHKIYQHELEVFRAYMEVKTDGTWLDYAIFNMLADRLGTYQAFEWVQSSYAPLAGVALKIVKDERGHCNMGYLNVRDFLETADDAGRAHVQKRIDEHFYPFHMAAFGGENSRNNRMWRQMGLKLHSNERLRYAYHTEMQEVLASLGLDCPDYDDAKARGLEAAAALKKAAA